MIWNLSVSYKHNWWCAPLKGNTYHGNLSFLDLQTQSSLTVCCVRWNFTIIKQFHWSFACLADTFPFSGLLRPLDLPLILISCPITCSDRQTQITLSGCCVRWNIHIKPWYGQMTAGESRHKAAKSFDASACTYLSSLRVDGRLPEEADETAW